MAMTGPDRLAVPGKCPTPRGMVALQFVSLYSANRPSTAPAMKINPHFVISSNYKQRIYTWARD